MVIVQRLRPAFGRKQETSELLFSSSVEEPQRQHIIDGVLELVVCMKYSTFFSLQSNETPEE